MNQSSKRYDRLREDLIANLSLDFFEYGEIDYIVSEIESYDVRVRQKLLALFIGLSHASSALVPGLLDHIKTASRNLSPESLDHWLSDAFDLRDSQGIGQAIAFLSRVDRASLAAFQAEGFPLRKAAPMLETYLRAMSGRQLRIMPGRETYTDTDVLYLPASINSFAEDERNLAVYKLAVANAWAQIAIGTLTLDADIKVITDRFPGYPLDHADIESFFNCFSERRLSLDLYTVIESFRAEYFLMKELPGLMKRAASIKQDLYQERRELDELSGKSAFVETLWQYYLTGKIKGTPGRNITRAMASLFGIQYEAAPKESIKLLYDVYDTAAALPGDYQPRPVPIFIARILPAKISARLQKVKEARIKKLEGIISRLLSLPDLTPPERHGERTSLREARIEPSREYLLIKGRLMELDQDVRSLIEQKGGIPGGVLVQGSEIGGATGLVLQNWLEEDEEKRTGENGIKYDEWDYKRFGYKKRWCSLFEQDIRPGSEPFVELTLRRYGGYVTVLRKKFELLKRERRLKRRQKDGDDVDFDALVETFSDIRAGVSPSNNLFSRIERQERDIAVLFLVDMSGSTRGWVNQAEKESLVLLSEALEMLGDRYAVYGFSGMTRNRCDWYRIKAFDERYGEQVKRRIAGIEPKDYTRMAPFIRHAACLLRGLDARIKLLITLSDSKPEDWDGYKGDYAIEDTRKALVETSGQGIHPFCITIDREAQSYLPHLFGRGNYILIDEVRKLPSRITEIYRKLTT